MDSNGHISTSQLSIILADLLADCENRIGGRVTLAPLGRLKPVADATTKFLLAAGGRPYAVLICSRPAAPELVLRGVHLAEVVRGMVGPNLGEAIIKPFQSGYAGELSYVILPWCREFSSWRALRAMQRLALIRPLLNWLLDATAAAVISHGPSNTAGRTFGECLEHLIKQSFLNNEIKAAISTSIGRIESGKWKPHHAVDHNDFWLGNVMLPAKSRLFAKSRYPFVIIDWAGANPRGHGIYDLIRLAIGAKLTPQVLRRELISHSNALQCDLADTCGHLLSAFGRLHQHIECFPMEMYIRTLHNCWSVMRQALPENTQ